MKLSRQPINHHSASQDNARDVVKGSAFFGMAAEDSFFRSTPHLERKCEECDQEGKSQLMSQEDEEVQKKNVTEEEEEVQKKEAPEQEEDVKLKAADMDNKKNVLKVLDAESVGQTHKFIKLNKEEG
jgi:hypothetical protein